MAEAVSSSDRSGGFGQTRVYVHSTSNIAYGASLDHNRSKVSRVRVVAPPILPTEHPWINTTAKEFWVELQDVVLLDMEQDQRRRSLGRSPGDRTRQQWKMSPDEHRQGGRDQALRRNLEAEAP